MTCESFKRETDQTCRERCGRRTVGYVISGPMFVCRQHAEYWERHDEPVMWHRMTPAHRAPDPAELDATTERQHAPTEEMA